MVNWVNAPFCLLDQVLGLIKNQGAVAAVVVPRGAGGRWDVEAVSGRGGYCGEMTFDPAAPQNRMAGQQVNPYKGLYAVVFVDFRSKGSRRLCALRPAEELRRVSVTADLGEGELLMSRVSGSIGGGVGLSSQFTPLPRELR